MESNMKSKYLFPALAAALALTGCSSGSLLEKELDDTWTTEGYVAVGSRLTVENKDSRLVLQDKMDALSADGLYYVSWTMGSAEPYENSDGDTVDLYDAQLYLLLGEFPDSEKAYDNMETWLAAAQANYEVLTKKEAACSGYTYSLITYNCVSDDNPFERGASAFGAFEDTAVCIEFTCRENFEEEPESILTDFLGSCTYHF